MQDKCKYTDCVKFERCKLKNLGEPENCSLYEKEETKVENTANLINPEEFQGN